MGNLIRYWLIVVLLLADQALKTYIRTKLVPGWSIVLIPGVLNLTYLRNSGAAFGLLTRKTEFSVIITVVAISTIIYVYPQLPKNKKMLRTGLSLGLAGALGNLIDRVRFGYVIDMFDLNFWPGIFNLADLAIVVGVILIIIDLLVVVEREAER